MSTLGLATRTNHTEQSTVGSIPLATATYTVLCSPMTKSLKRVLDETLLSDPPIPEPKTLEAPVVKYMQEARKEPLQSFPGGTSDRGLNRSTAIDKDVQRARQGRTRVSTTPLSPSVYWLYTLCGTINRF